MMFRSFALFLLLFPLAAAAQQAETVLATAKGRTFTQSVLSPAARQALANERTRLDEARTSLLSQYVLEELLRLEAKAANSTPEKLIDARRASVPEPPAAQIQAVYDANRAALGGRPLADVRKDIIAFLNRDAEDKAIGDYVASLQAKYKYAAGKSVNASPLGPLDVVATIGTRQITAREFEDANKFQLNDIAWHLYEDVRADLEVVILNALIEEEAKARNATAGDVIAAEVTDKMRTFADGEREELETALMKRLFAKYEVKIAMKEPSVIVQNISADDDPALGPAGAPVTIVMFSDFQCPACARTHPVLKRVIAEHGGKVRIVVRDNPLENIHADAFAAAVAANAAHAQGKYFEYIELLYRNQNALDAASLKRYAAEIGLNAKQFELDLSRETTAAEIRKDLAEGESYGVSGTPTIFVNGVKVHRLSPDAFRRAIERALAK